MKKMFQMYTALKREVYILCFGRFVTAMGSLIWPMLTLILKSKLGLNAEQVAAWFLGFGVVQLPLSLIGGKVTDKYNKRNIIILFDSISVVLYILTSMLPLSTTSLCVYFAGSLFQHMEWPAYDALIAELTQDHEREKAYSLQYLANNLGVVFAPTLGGLLFNHYLWLSFLIAGVAVLSSTLLIYFYIPQNLEKTKNTNTYERHEEGSLWNLFQMRKIMFVYILLSCVAGIVYAQFNYLLPIQMDEMFSEKGAMLFGMLTSINGAVVIFCTPLLTQVTLKWKDLSRVRLGVFLEVAGICSNVFYHQEMVLYIVAMIVFTLGEILTTLGGSPYISKRIPSSHRGRYTAFSNLFTTTSSSLGNMLVGKIVVLYSFRKGWAAIAVIGAILVAGQTLYQRADRREFALLYEKNK